MWVFSDVHIDSAPYYLPQTPVDVDVIVFAGDITDGRGKGRAWINDLVHAHRGIPVIYVLGNHDFYGADLTWDSASFFASAGGILLHPSRPTWVYKDVRFVGSTLWTDYAIAGDVRAARAWARYNMPDLQDIDLGMRRARTRDFLGMHRMQRMILERELSVPFSGSTVVVTHHAPHPKSLRVPTMITPDDGSYASDLTAVMEQFEPAVWVHGHVHASHDYYVSATRVVCNPRGYAVTTKDGKFQGNAGFEPAKVVEI